MTFPKFLLKEIEDEYTQENFLRIADYFADDPLTRSGFEFLEITLSTAVTDFQHPHRLGYVPKDIILMHNLTNTVTTFNYSKFTETMIFITTAAATTLRLLVGRYE
jgi:hypothetical protein